MMLLQIMEGGTDAASGTYGVSRGLSRRHVTLDIRPDHSLELADTHRDHLAGLQQAHEAVFAQCEMVMRIR